MQGELSSVSISLPFRLITEVKFSMHFDHVIFLFRLSLCLAGTYKIEYLFGLFALFGL